MNLDSKKTEAEETQHENRPSMSACSKRLRKAVLQRRQSASNETRYERRSSECELKCSSKSACAA